MPVLLYEDNALYAKFSSNGDRVEWRFNYYTRRNDRLSRGRSASLEKLAL
jgi:hypothetical protein